MASAAPALEPCPHCGAEHAPDVLVCPVHDQVLPLEGRLIDGKFRLHRQLGEGGMSTVWEAENELVHRRVAIKLMLPELASNPVTLGRFRNEATSAGRIGNAHICDILDFGQCPAGPYIVMELLKGHDLATFINSHDRMAAGTAVLIIRQALAGLAAAHEAGIVHRDLKPENVFLHQPEPDRLQVKLMDFGISKFSESAVQGKTMTGILMGTPAYMAPEQVEGATRVDVRTDIWAMGAVLYATIAGRVPFAGSTVGAVLMAVTEKPHRSLTELGNAVNGLDPELSEIVDRCLAKSPDDRFQTALALSRALLPFESRGAHDDPGAVDASASAGVVWTPPRMRDDLDDPESTSDDPPTRDDAGKGVHGEARAVGASPDAGAERPGTVELTGGSVNPSQRTTTHEPDASPRSPAASSPPDPEPVGVLIPADSDARSPRPGSSGRAGSGGSWSGGSGLATSELEAKPAGPSASGPWNEGSPRPPVVRADDPGVLEISASKAHIPPEMMQGPDGPNVHVVPDRVLTRSTGRLGWSVLAGALGLAAIAAIVMWTRPSGDPEAGDSGRADDVAANAAGEGPGGSARDTSEAAATGAGGTGGLGTAVAQVGSATAGPDSRATRGGDTRPDGDPGDSSGSSTAKTGGSKKTETPGKKTGQKTGQKTGKKTGKTTKTGTGGDTTFIPGTGTKTPAKDPPPQVKMSMVHRLRGQYVPRELAPSGDHDAAKAYCRQLRRRKYAGLRQWQLAGPATILSFAKLRAVKRTLYWSRSRATRTAKAVNMFSGKVKDLDPKSRAARPFCVASR